MKLFFYYASHALLNQVKKLLRTWVAVFILVCALLGGLIGVGAGLLAEHALPEEEPPVEEEVLPDEAPSPEEILRIADLVATGVLLLALTLGLLRADKSGNEIFQGGDVAILFPSPMKPQSVLLFRLTCGLGSMLILALYLLFQIPSMLSMGVGFVFILSLFLALGLTVVLSQFVSVLLYLLSSAYPRVKKGLRTGLYAFLGLLVLGVFVRSLRDGGGSIAEAAVGFFSSPYTRLFPLFGWLKGGFMYALEGKPLLSAAGFLLAAAGGALVLLLCYRVRADYYEEAVAATEERTAALLAAAEGRAVKRKKDRADRLKRDGLRFGRGASVFFFKALYNRFRFATLRVFTKTSVLYLFVSVCAAAVYLLATRGEGDGLTYLFVTGLILGGLTFFRALGSPLNTDLSQNVFFMSPDSHRSKLLWSLLGGSACLCLDLIPALLVSTLLLWVNPLYTLLLLLFIVSVDLYSAGVGVFLELVLPTSLDKNIRAAFLVLFVYFGLLPVAAALVLGWLLVNAVLGFLLGTLTALFVGGVLLLFAPAILASGRK